MAGKKLDYRQNVKTNLGKYMIKHQAEKMLETNKKISMAEIVRSISEYCDLTPFTIIQYKREKAIPSLSVALKLARYFDCKIDDLFLLEGGE